jgi:LmbE family N-acetylglucosaminyl deacetylase
MSTLSVNDLGPAGRILCLGAHCDDIEIGCGATIAAVAKRHPGVHIAAIIFCSNSRRKKETQESMNRLLDGHANLELHVASFRDGYLPYEGAAVKEYLAETVSDMDPDVVFTHYRQDLHQDHRFVGEITYQLFRNSLILEMEIPKYDGDLGRPNIFFPARKEIADRKISTLMECYPSQFEKDWFTDDTFAALLRLRGLECRSESGMAEAFYATKIVVT